LIDRFFSTKETCVFDKPQKRAYAMSERRIFQFANASRYDAKKKVNVLRVWDRVCRRPVVQKEKA